MSVPRQVYAREAPPWAIPIDQRVRLPPQVIRHILRGDQRDAKPEFFCAGRTWLLEIQIGGLERLAAIDLLFTSIRKKNKLNK
ncbi:hypothetical protein D3C76_1578230 [compost metagenome]